MYGIGAITHPTSAMTSPACQKPILWNMIVIFAVVSNRFKKKTGELWSREVVRKFRVLQEKCHTHPSNLTSTLP